MAVTDSDGYFRAADAILDRVANHRRQYAVLALAPEGVGYALAGDKGQDPSNMELRLTAPVKFPVRVLDESGQPLGGAGMQARPNVLKVTVA